MTSVHSSLTVFSDHTFGRNIIDVLFASFLQFIEQTLLSLILLCNFIKEFLVEKRIREGRILNEYHRNIRMLIADYPEEFLPDLGATRYVDHVLPVIKKALKKR